MNMISQIIEIFVSIEVPMELRKKAAAIVKELPEETIKPIRSEDMHLKLAHFEHYRPERFNEIKQELATVEFSPFTITLKGVELTPDIDHPRVIWVGVEREPSDLSKKVDKALEGIVEKRPCRIQERLQIADVWKWEGADFSGFLKKHKDEEFGSFKVDKFYLMQSYFDLKNPRKYMVMREFGSG
jgi:2'-5' RNA ligase